MRSLLTYLYTALFLSLLLFCSLGTRAQSAAMQELRKVVVDDPNSVEGKVLRDVRIGHRVEMADPGDPMGRARKYRVLRIDSVRFFHVHYIFLNGAQLSRPEIDSLRSVIMSDLKTGTPFEELAARHGMDGNRTGDWGRKSEHDAVREFSDAVFGKAPGDVFTVDVPTNNWYYVVHKDAADEVVRTYHLEPLRNHSTRWRLRGGVSMPIR